MGIFKDQKWIDPKKVKIPNFMKLVFKILEKSLCILGLIFNGFMVLMMLIRFSPFSLFFLVNFYFIARFWRRLKS